ncbi:hypothetical protein GQ54DRAFT_214537 [Martensiomyces pterosporus]|nr:hypothetical protein GQ54DRAFT_214537 [Martensiomyces pterosporus]
MDAAGDMDDDDICPICEDECTCGNSRVSAVGDDVVGEGVPMPLFSQVAKESRSIWTSASVNEQPSPVMPAASSISDDDDDEFDLLAVEDDNPKRELAKRKSKKTEAQATKTKTKSKTKSKAKPKAKKGKGSERNLISRLVSAMGNGKSAMDSDIDAETVEEELFSAEALPPLAGNAGASSSDEENDDSAFVSAVQFSMSRSDGRVLPDDEAGDLTSAYSHADPDLTAAVKLAKKSKSKTKAKSKTAKTGRRSKKESDKPTADGAPGSWRSKGARSGAAIDEPTVYEVDATVIRGRNRRSPAKPATPPAKLASEATDEDEFINITDVTSDMSTGFPSETEFDLPDSKGEELARRAEWSDSNMLGDDENIEQEEEAYLAQMRNADFSSSSLSDLDEDRLAGIHRHLSGADIDSGTESDSESSDGEGARTRHSRSRRRHSSSTDISDLDSDASLLSDIGSLSSLPSNGSASESDEELTFREARTDEERALLELRESGDEREDAILELHLEQLRAVRNVIQGCSSPLIGHSSLSDSDSSSDVVDREISFTYNPREHDEKEDLSDDLMEGWGSDARMRWEVESDSTSDSSLNESKMNKLRLKDEDDNHSDLYSSDSADSYDEFYTRSAFLDGASDGLEESLEDALYPDGLDLDSASLALGVALSMEQQGYSKEDAVAAAAVAAAAYPNSSSNGATAGMLNKQMSTTTITASMNAHGEADPIDGIVSIKSSNAGGSGSRTGFMSPSRMPTGAHTPFVAPGWRAAAAAAAAAYLDGPKPPAIPYVLPKDLNEARSPSIAAAVQQTELSVPEAASTASPEPNDNSSSAVDNAAPESEQQQGAYKTASPSSVIAAAAAAAKEKKSREASVSPKSAQTLSTSSSGIFTTQLPNSSFYKPLSSICSPVRRTPSNGAVPIGQGGSGNEPASDGVAPQPNTDASASTGVGVPDVPGTTFAPGTPLVSLAEVNAALTMLADQAPASASPATMANRPGQSGNMLKRKMSDGRADDAQNSGADEKRVKNSTASGSGADSVFDGLAGESSISIDLSAFFADGAAMDNDTPTISLSGTPQRNKGGTPADMNSIMSAGEKSAEDDWLLAMDQLVDTEALLIKSPPPSPADATGLEAATPDISHHLSPLARGGSSEGSGAGADPFARWDRIPVNIFRRSRALASSHRRDIMAQDSVLGAMPSLALTAIKSSRQRRALVNTTLLAQHTLPAEAALQQHAMKLASRGRRGIRTSTGSYSQLAAAYPPPPPPPTPLDSNASTRQSAGDLGSSSAASLVPLQMLQDHKIGHSMSEQPGGLLQVRTLGSSSAATSPPRVLARADSRHERHKQLASNGIVTEPGTPWDSSSQVSDHSEAAAGSNGNNLGAPAAASTGPTTRRRRSNSRPDASSGNSSEYAFGWVETEEDLALFSMPELTPGDGSSGAAAMVLASASPMLMPFRADTLQPAASGSDVGSDTHLTL